jgi:hypothetical protein
MENKPQDAGPRSEQRCGTQVGEFSTPCLATGPTMVRHWVGVAATKAMTPTHHAKCLPSQTGLIWDGLDNGSNGKQQRPKQQQLCQQ